MLLTTGEIKRTKARFGLLTFGAGLLVFVLLFEQVLLDGVLDGFVGAQRNQSAEVMAFAVDAKQILFASLITPDQLNAVRQAPGVGDVSELGVGSASFHPTGNDDPGAFKDAQIFGFRPGRAGQPTNIVSGRSPTAPNEIAASIEDAPGRYKIGSTVTTDPGGRILTVVGLTEGSRYNVGPTFWMTWDGYEQLVRSSNPDATIVLPSVLAINPAPGVSPDQLAAQLRTLRPDLDVVTNEAALATATGVNPVRIAFMMVLGLGYVVVAFVIGFFFLTLTLQKMASITLLRAVGASSNYLLKSILTQVLLVTLGGLVVGIGLLYATVPVLKNSIPISPKASTIITTAVAAMVVAALGTIPAMRRIIHTDPNGVFAGSSAGVSV